MRVIPFHINRAERSGGAEVLAGAAADAGVFIDGRHLHRAVRALVVHHRDGSRGTVAGAVAAADTVGEDHTVLFDPHGMTDMLHGLFFPRDGLDGAGGADLATARAFGTAVTALKRHRGLHEMLQVGGGTQDIVGA